MLCCASAVNATLSATKGRIARILVFIRTSTVGNSATVVTSSYLKTRTTALAGLTHALAGGGGQALALPNVDGPQLQIMRGATPRGGSAARNGDVGTASSGGRAPGAISPLAIMMATIDVG